MKKSFTLTVICLCLALNIPSANAGIWETITGFFGSKSEPEEQAPAEEAPVTPQTSNEVEAPKSTTQAVIQTAIGLIPTIMSTMDVSKGQAQGGLGAILQAAQVILSGQDFSQLLGAIPNAQGLLGMAPKLSSNAGSNTESNKTDLLGAALNAAAEKNKTIGAAKNLMDQFKSLGLDPNQIPQFTQITQKYLKSENKSEAAQLLSTAMSAFPK